MTNEIFMRLVMAIATVIGCILSAYVIPYLKVRVTDQQMEQLNYYISVAVRCAEQIYSPEDWKMKKTFVMNYITEVLNRKLSIKLDALDIDTMIEGIVNEIKKGGTS